MGCFHDLLKEPCGDHATAAPFERVRGYRDWGVSDLEDYTWFMTVVGCTTPIEDW